jgi:hypothetical protein
MTDRFVESLGEKLAERWLAASFTPAFVFWAGGLAAFIRYNGWDFVTVWYGQLIQPWQLGALLTALLLVTVSAFVVQRFDRAVVHVLMGIWPAWANGIQRHLVRKASARTDKLEARLQMLLSNAEHAFSPGEVEERRNIELSLHYVPADVARRLPTRLGNIIRAGEARPESKYGLDAVVCWPRLWLVLPDGAKTELQNARDEVNVGARTILWGLLFTIWSLWIWWALPIGVAIVLFGYHWVTDSAIRYADLLEAAFDLYRPQLYKALRWPLPENPKAEQKMGRLVTAYLWRGSDEIVPTFTVPNASETDDPKKFSR